MTKYKMPKCKICGTRFSLGANYCKNCGSKLGNSLQSEFYDKFTADMLFSNIFKIHNKKELEDIFVVKSTENSETLSIDKLCPWFYSRLFLILSVIFAIFEICLCVFNNELMIPSVMFLGSLIMPFCILMLFYELNIFKDISFYSVIIYFLFGGAISLLFTVLLYQFFPSREKLDFCQALIVAVVEEVGKAIPIILLLNHRKSKNILTGLLIGSAIGCGFAIFESAGYAFNSYLYNHDMALINNVDTSTYFDNFKKSTFFMNGSIFLRAILAFGGHTVWASITGAAYAREKTINLKFLKYFFMPVVFHLLWDWNRVPELFTQDLLSIIAWGVIIYFINNALIITKKENNSIKIKSVQLKLQDSLYKKRSLFKIIVCFFCLSVVLFFMYCYEYSEKNIKNSALLYYQEQFSEYELARMNSINSPLGVTIDRVYNAANGSENLNHMEITYLSFDITVTKKDEKLDSGEFLIKYINPEGNLMFADNYSPKGYTFKMPIEQKFDGWGNEHGGTYGPGIYTIKIYYGYNLIAMKHVYIK